MNSRIIILQRILPHYRKGFFKKLHAAFPETKIFYGQPFKKESLKNDDNLNNKYFIPANNIYMDKRGKIFLSAIYSKLLLYKPGIVISGFSVTNLNIYFIFILKYFIKYKIILWSFGYDPHKGFHPETNFLDKIRLFFYQRADAVIFYWDKGKESVEIFSKKKDHYFVAPNTLDTSRQFDLKNKFDTVGRDILKKELGVSVKYHFIYIGRLLEDKQIDVLLRSYSILESTDSDCGLSIIGEGPMKNILQKLSSELKLKNICFHGEILDEEITGKWIYISHAFVMPGRLGLSVVHSFCFGTPVISQNKTKYFHGEGIGYMKDGINGFLTENGNINELADKMNEIISDPELSGRLRHNAFMTAKNECSIESMVNGFSDTINFVRKI
ncbi:MAG: glycosyltransferase family 4 protein [bacterium]